MPGLLKPHAPTSNLIAATLLCLVVGVSDGDTLTARCPATDATHPYQQVKVRLAGIDAPEKRQPYGNRSRQHLADLCFQVNAEIRPRETDRYGRTVADITCQGKDAGAAQVRAGMAWVFVRYAKHHQHLYASENAARTERLGLWANPEPIPPWEWRRRK